jgi:hypothetical protein
LRIVAVTVAGPVLPRILSGDGAGLVTAARKEYCVATLSDDGVGLVTAARKEYCVAIYNAYRVVTRSW